MDLIQMLVNLASDLTSASIDLALALGSVGGIAALIIYLNRRWLAWTAGVSAATACWPRCACVPH